MTSIPRELLSTVASWVERYETLDEDARRGTEVNLAGLLKAFREKKRQKPGSAR
jgi:hypothetical protein